MAIMAVAAVASAGSVAVGLIAVETLATIALITTAVGYVTDSPILKKIGAGMGIGAAGAGLMGLGESVATTGASSANAAASSSSSVAPMSTAEIASTQGLNTVQSMGLVDTLPTVSSTGAVSEGIVSGAQAVNSASLANTPVNTVESMGLTKDLSVSAPTGAQGMNAINTPFDNNITKPPPNITSKGFFDGIKGDDLIKVGGDMLKGIGQSQSQDQMYELQKSRLGMEQEAFNINKQKEANRNSIPLGSGMYNKAFQLKASALPSGIIQTAQKG